MADKLNDSLWCIKQEIIALRDESTQLKIDLAALNTQVDNLEKDRETRFKFTLGIMVALITAAGSLLVALVQTFKTP